MKKLEKNKQAPMHRGTIKVSSLCFIAPAVAAFSAALVLSGCATGASRTEKAAAGPAASSDAASCMAPGAAQREPAGAIAGEPAKADEGKAEEWTIFFQDDSIEGWVLMDADNFMYNGKVWVEAGTLMMDAGMPSTGLAWTGDFPEENYEIRLEAMRRSDMDIFCGVHFPVGEEYVSLLVGGWSDTVVGLSCVNGARAAYNETSTFMKFHNDRWYGVRILVTKEKIEVWIDDRQSFALEREGRKIHDCPGLDALRPFGFFTYNTSSALRNVRVRKLGE